MTFAFDRKMNFDILLESIRVNLREIVKATGLDPVFRMNTVRQNEVLVWDEPKVKFLNADYFESANNEYFVKYMVENKVSKEAIEFFFAQIALIDFKLNILYYSDDYLPFELGDYLEASAKNDGFCLSFTPVAQAIEQELCSL